MCPYLRELGVGAIYCSPLLTASPGSSHGYDVVDHRAVDAERGGEPGWRSLVQAARENSLEIVIDIVPNHMGVAAAQHNRQWWDVLRLGQESPFSQWFDIDWQRGRLTLAVLADSASEADLKLVDGELHYFEHRFPVAPGTEGVDPSAVHDRQRYELLGFRRADTDLNYRRFFAVTALAGLRVEDSGVFDATHEKFSAGLMPVR